MRTRPCGVLALRVVETSVAWRSPREHLLYPISPACLALPDAALRALSADYLATLPADTQDRVRARLRR